MATPFLIFQESAQAARNWGTLVLCLRTMTGTALLQPPSTLFHVYGVGLWRCPPPSCRAGLCLGLNCCPPFPIPELILTHPSKSPFLRDVLPDPAGCGIPTHQEWFSWWLVLSWQLSDFSQIHTALLTISVYYVYDDLSNAYPWWGPSPVHAGTSLPGFLLNSKHLAHLPCERRSVDTCWVTWAHLSIFTSQHGFPPPMHPKLQPNWLLAPSSFGFVAETKAVLAHSSSSLWCRQLGCICLNAAAPPSPPKSRHHHPWNVNGNPVCHFQARFPDFPHVQIGCARCLEVSGHREVTWDLNITVWQLPSRK